MARIEFVAPLPGRAGRSPQKEDAMRGALVVMVGFALAVAACASSGSEGSPQAGEGGSNEPVASTSGGDQGGRGSVIDPQSPGQASVSVDGVEYRFDGAPLIACTMVDGFSYSFVSEDGKVTLAAGGQDFGESGWGGSIKFTMTGDEPDPASGELGFVTYIVFLKDVDASAMALDGESMSFRGPMWKQTPGSTPPGDEAGTGTVSVTCP